MASSSCGTWPSPDADNGCELQRNQLRLSNRVPVSVLQQFSKNIGVDVIGMFTARSQVSDGDSQSRVDDGSQASVVLTCGF